MSGPRRAQGLPATIVAGALVGIVASTFATAFAALVFQGLLIGYVANGIGLYLAAAAITLGLFAWRAGARGVIGSPQAVMAAVLAVVATGTALGAYGGPDRAFQTVVAATLVVTVLTGIAFLVIGASRRGHLIRYVPYPVVGGFLAGVGWLLLKGGIGVASGLLASLGTIGDLIQADQLWRWLPALAFGGLVLLLGRVLRHPLVLPIAIGAGLAAFAVGMLVSGSSIDAARDGRWLLGPFPPGYLWQPWTLRAITGADWIGVLQQAPSIVTAVFVAVLAMPMNVGGTELTLRRDLDPNRELRDAGVTNVVVGAAGGIPGYHAVGLISLADRLRANARGAGIVGALVPLLAVLVGVDVLELVPRMLVGGVLVYAGLGLIVEWLWDRRVILSPSDRLVVLAILLAIAWRGLLPGVVLGLVLSLVQFAIDYGRIELVSEAAFGETFRSTVDRAPAERAFLRAQAGRVQILRADGFVFFGTASALLERVRRRAEAGDLRYLVVDLHRVSGMDASAVVSLRKAAGIARTDGFELVFTGMSQQVRARLARGAVMDEPGVVGFEPDLDHGLQRCEDGLLAEGRDEGTAPPVDAGSPDRTLIGVPAGLDAYLERIVLAEGSVLIHQGEVSEDLFLLAAGRLRIEMAMRDGTRIRMRTVLPGVVVGEIALYTGTARTADVTAETPSEVLRLSRASIERLEAERPELATAVHRWLASTVAERLTFTQRAIGALID